MHFLAIADTDIGIARATNQDSALVKHAVYGGSEVLLAVLSDGMGGLSRGEVASATVVRACAKWFEEALPFELEQVNLRVIGEKWALLLKELNTQIGAAAQAGREMGTTCTGLLLIDGQYVLVHVGDTRAYHLASGIRQLTTDQTFVAREVSRGTMTLAEAALDKRQNMLLQCIGASPIVAPEILTGQVGPGAYLLCSDGFRHVISDGELYESLNPVNLVNRDAMHSNVRYLIDEVKRRGERDNISVILIKAEEGAAL